MPTAITPTSSAARPIRATVPSVFVPVKLSASATTSSSTVRPNVASLVAGMPNRLARNPLPYSATAVMVTIIAQM